MSSTEPSGLLTGAERLWNACAGSLRERLTDATWKTWFEGVQASALADRRLVLTRFVTDLSQEDEVLLRQLLADSDG